MTKLHVAAVSLVYNLHDNDYTANDNISVWKNNDLVLFVTCKNCNKQFKTETNLRYHIETDNKIQIIYCLHTYVSSPTEGRLYKI